MRGGLLQPPAVLPTLLISAAPPGSSSRIHPALLILQTAERRPGVEAGSSSQAQPRAGRVGADSGW